MEQSQLDQIRANADNYIIGVVTARFNEPVTSRLREGALGTLKEHGIANYFDISVPGAFELPLAAKWLIEKKKCDAVITLGAVIRGETAHFDFVCNGAERGCTLLQLEKDVPVAFGVITTENAEQAFARAGGAKGNKGEDAALVALEMLALKDQFSV